MMRVSAERGTVFGGRARPRRPAGSSGCRCSSEMRRQRRPCIVFSRSASSSLVERPRAISVVTCWPPMAIASAWTNSPSWKTDIVVVPPPKSIRRRRARPHRRPAPRGRCVRRGDHRLDSRWQRLMASSRLRSGASSAVTTCMSTPSVSPSMPRGSRDAAIAVERIADRQRMDDHPPALTECARAGGEHAPDISLDDRAGDRRSPNRSRSPAGRRRC